MDDKAEAEQLKKREDVKTALKQTSGTKETLPKPAAQWRDKLWFGTYILASLAILALYSLLGSSLIPAEIKYIPILRALLIAALLIVLTVAIAKSIRVDLIDQIEDRPARYNLTRVLNLLTFLAVVIIGLSLLFHNWYTGSSRWEFYH